MHVDSRGRVHVGGTGRVPGGHHTLVDGLYCVPGGVGRGCARAAGNTSIGYAW
ncbi:hypothetical protein [Streptomyces sp. CC224B]|uniref:hypothetical protein n=1 Tax=Streptomyces sp. CC224B TaxID=3044571 RepID=UPI0024A7EAC1|nr:hypothetical protein [Streptomyces sp. CC224B]